MSKAKATKATKKAAATPAPKKTPRINLMREYYGENVLPNIGTDLNKVLRRNFINKAMELGASDASGASMFNVIQKSLIADGTLRAEQVGRGAQAVAKAAAEAAAEAEAQAAAEAAAAGPGPWTVVNKETRAVVSDWPTKKTATENRGEGETVVKTASLEETPAE